MKPTIKFAALVALILTFLALPLRSISAADDDEYSFKLHNTTKNKITKLLASEDGKDFGNFDVGAGIEAGKTTTLKWDKKTNARGCEWYLKAVYADGTESEPKKFDFCEKDLEVEI